MTDGQAFKALIWPLRSAMIACLLLMIFWALCVGLQIAYAYRSSEDTSSALNHLNNLVRQELMQTSELPSQLFSVTETTIIAGTATRDAVAAVVLGGMRVLLNLPQSMKGNRERDNAIDQDPGRTYAAAWWADSGEILKMILSANFIFISRSLAFIAGLPAIVLFYVVGFFDGRSGRSVRRADVMRESSNIYHRAKIGQLWLFSAFYLVYLSLPFAPPPAYVVIPCCLGCAFLWRTQIAYYKKYA